jgi:ribonucleoside-diphosphate reductase beta chain
MPIINNSKTDPNKILPIRYPWAREHYKTGVRNNWVPEEVPMQDDVEMWKSNKLSAEERRLILWALGFFSTAESLTANNLVLAVYNHVTNPETRQAILRQAFEEALHTDTVIYCCDSLGLDPDEVYGMYETIPSIKDKDSFVVELTKSLLDPSFTTEGDKNVQLFLRDLIGFYVIMEGIFFYAGFAMLLAMKRHKKMVGIGEQFEFVMRDESMHLSLGCDIINTIRSENPQAWTPEFEQEIIDLIVKAVELEKVYAIDACPKGLLGINSSQFSQYVEYIADRRLERLGLPKQFGKENPFPWLSMSTDLSKEKNFFETKVTEYSSAGALTWD